MNKKEKLIKTAIKLFVKQGFDNTPTSQISKEARVATGTLFHHFETKEELINEAYVHTKKSLVSAVKIDDEKNVKESLRQTWHSIINWGQENKTELAFFSQFSNSSYITKLSRAKGKEVLEPITNILARGAKEGVFKELPQEILEQICFTTMCSFLSYQQLSEELINKGFQTLWDAIKR